jgi:serine/threonine-protein kinase
VPVSNGERLLPKLFVFGGVRLVDGDGHSPVDLLAQTKIFALLVYLVLSEPRGFHRRDTLLGLLWPELDGAHARGALRKAIHVLRRELGDRVLERRGEEEIGIAGAELWCDAAQFDEAIAAGRVARALELYRGDLLPGLFVRDASEFEQWLAPLRTRYQRQAATAAWVLAETSEESERATIAADWARRAVTLAPFDERIVRKALALLGRVGDRAGAVALFESFRQQLAREYGVEPAVETGALIRQIRAR